ncbi:DUF6766 family protein [Kitasatospora sp. MBT63]|uniref:DUF6766 family protein n=1 Tax=Kitasatospora sp. MBT63 TaxID=1444768 RepID=UPI0034CD23F4
MWLLQRGLSGTTSKRSARTRPTSPAWARADGLRSTLYSRSLGMVMALFFLGSWGAQSVTGVSASNAGRCGTRAPSRGRTTSSRSARLTLPVASRTDAAFWSRPGRGRSGEHHRVGAAGRAGRPSRAPREPTGPAS